MTSKERSMVSKLGYYIIEKINNGLKVFPSAIVAAILLQHPQGIDRGGGTLDNDLFMWDYVIFLLEELLKMATWLRKEVELRGGQVEWKEG